MGAPDPADERFAAFMAERGTPACPSCGRVLDRGDVAWNNASTEVGTEYVWAEVACQACDTEIAYWSSWWPSADNWEEFVERILPEMPALGRS